MWRAHFALVMVWLGLGLKGVEGWSFGRRAGWVGGASLAGADEGQLALSVQAEREVLVQKGMDRNDLSMSFSTTRLTAKCPGDKEFQLYIAPTKVQLTEAVSFRRNAFCTWRLVSDGRGTVDTCSVTLSPYSDYYAYIRAAGVTSKVSNLIGEQYCTLVHEYVTPWWLPVTIALGITLFFSSPFLSQNSLFRTCASALLCTVVAVVFLGIVMYRTASGPGALWKMLAIALLPILGTYFFGSYYPILFLMNSRSLLLMYVLFFMLTGMVISYVYEETLSDPRVGRVLNLVLRVTGISLLYMVIQSDIAFTVLSGLALTCALIWQTEACPAVRKAFNQQLLGLLRPKPAPLPPPSPKKEVLEGPRTPILPASPGTALLNRAAAASTPSGKAQHCSPRRAMNFSSPLATPSAGCYTPYSSDVSPLVAEGRILNGKTNRIIQLHGATYKKLVRSGFSPDFETGVLSPPGPFPQPPGAD